MLTEEELNEEMAKALEAEDLEYCIALLKRGAGVNARKINLSYNHVAIALRHYVNTHDTHYKTRTDTWHLDRDSRDST